MSELKTYLNTKPPKAAIAQIKARLKSEDESIYVIAVGDKLAALTINEVGSITKLSEAEKIELNKIKVIKTLFQNDVKWASYSTLPSTISKIEFLSGTTLKRLMS